MSEREPVMVDGKLTGYRVTTPPIYTKVRDNRGYESIMLLHWGETVFEPVKRQRELLEDQ